MDRRPYRQTRQTELINTFQFCWKFKKKKKWGVPGIYSYFPMFFKKTLEFFEFCVLRVFFFFLSLRILYFLCTNFILNLWDGFSFIYFLYLFFVLRPMGLYTTPLIWLCGKWVWLTRTHKRFEYITVSEVLFISNNWGKCNFIYGKWV